MPSPPFDFASTTRILALDYGKVRIGLAMSDPLGISAQSLPTLHRTRIREDIAHLAAIVRDNGVGVVLMGDPLRLSGEPSRQSARVREFAERLARVTGVRVEFWDERFTSVEAWRVLRESGMSPERRKQQIDKLSAVILLDSFLDAALHARMADA